MNLKKVNKLLQVVKNNYEEIADSFSVSRGKKMWPEIVTWANLVKPGDKVLDLGCGNGRLLEELPVNCDYLGVDNSVNLLNIAKQKYGERSRVEFRQLDLTKLAFLPKKDFQWIFAIAVWHHLPSKSLRIQAWKDLKNKLNDDGKAIVSVWNLRAWDKFRPQLRQAKLFNWLQGLGARDLLFNWQGGQISQRYYHAYTEKELKKEIKKVKLKLIDLKIGQGSLYVIIEK